MHGTNVIIYTSSLFIRASCDSFLHISVHSIKQIILVVQTYRPFRNVEIHIFITLLTVSMERNLSDKLVVSQLVKDFRASYGTGT